MKIGKSKFDQSEVEIIFRLYSYFLFENEEAQKVNKKIGIMK